MEDHQDIPHIHQGRDLILAVQGGNPVEGGRPLECGHQLTRRTTWVLVIDRVGNLFQVEGGGIAEHQQLDHGWHDEHHAAALVLEQGKKLLAH